jgi:hypothetical protein
MAMCTLQAPWRLVHFWVCWYMAPWRGQRSVTECAAISEHLSQPLSKDIYIIWLRLADLLPECHHRRHPWHCRVRGHPPPTI